MPSIIGDRFRGALLMGLAVLAAVWPSCPAAASVIVDRAPGASTIVEILITESGARLEFEGTAASPRTDVKIDSRPGRAVLLSSETSGQKGVAEYRFTSRPDTVTVTAPPDARDNEIGFVLYHLGLPVSDLHYLDGEAVVHLDWRDPWRSRFQNPRLRRQFDSALGVFLYVEPHAVRAEVVARPVDLQRWTDLGMGSDRVLPAARQASVRRQAADFLSRQLRLRIDGREVALQLDRADFLRRRLRTSAVIDPPEDLNAQSATLGVSYIVPIAAEPQTVELEWLRFGEGVERVAASVTDDLVSVPQTLVPGKNVLRWQNRGGEALSPTSQPPLPLPPRNRRTWIIAFGASLVLLAIAAATLALRLKRGAPPTRGTLLALFLVIVAAAFSFSQIRAAKLTNQQAGRLVEALLHGVYSGFEYRQEEAVYDTLSQYVSGDLLREIYLETRRSLELEELGGARTRVRAVEMVETSEVTATSAEGFQTHCTWQVTGSVGHWGHTHERRNQYEAVVTVRPTEGAWKITGLELVAESRL